MRIDKFYGVLDSIRPEVLQQMKLKRTELVLADRL